MASQMGKRPSTVREEAPREGPVARSALPHITHAAISADSGNENHLLITIHFAPARLACYSALPWHASVKMCHGNIVQFRSLHMSGVVIYVAGMRCLAIKTVSHNAA